MQVRVPTAYGHNIAQSAYQPGARARTRNSRAWECAGAHVALIGCAAPPCRSDAWCVRPPVSQQVPARPEGRRGLRQRTGRRSVRGVEALPCVVVRAATVVRSALATVVVALVCLQRAGATERDLTLRRPPQKTRVGVMFLPLFLAAVVRVSPGRVPRAPSADGREFGAVDALVFLLPPRTRLVTAKERGAEEETESCTDCARSQRRQSTGALARSNTSTKNTVSTRRVAARRRRDRQPERSGERSAPTHRAAETAPAAAARCPGSAPPVQTERE